MILTIAKAADADVVTEILHRQDDRKNSRNFRLTGRHIHTFLLLLYSNGLSVLVRATFIPNSAHSENICVCIYEKLVIPPPRDALRMKENWEKEKESEVSLT